MTQEQQHPITPPPELVASLRNSAPHGIRDAGVTRELWLINHAYTAGADQRGAVNEAELQKARDEELEACCEWVRSMFSGHPTWADELRVARHPKPPTLKEEALEAWEIANQTWTTASDKKVATIILRAIKALPND